MQSGVLPFVFMAKKIAIKIFYDEYTGEVEKVDCTHRFAEEGPLFRLDVLKDAMEALDHIYRYEHNKYFNEPNTIAKA